MDHSKRKSVHQQMMTRRASRSEYKDGLLRHNQRHENRLAKELEQWEKAQRTVARGLEKESQWFKHTNRPAPSSSSSPSRVLVRKNSLTDAEGGEGIGGGGGGPTMTPRFIPDYQYRNRTAALASAQAQGGHDEDGVGDGVADSAAVDEPDAPSSKSQHTKNSRPREDEKKRDLERKSAGRTASITSSTTTTTSTISSGPQSSTTKTSKKHPSATDTTTTTTTTTPTPTLPASTTNNTAASTTTTITKNTTTTTTTTTTEEDTTANAITPRVPKTSSSGARVVNSEVHDPGDVVLASDLRELELGWDGRRRYHNVWDSLSAPKRSNQVRSVRSRLQREFTVSGGGGGVRGVGVGGVGGSSNGLLHPHHHHPHHPSQSSSSSSSLNNKGFSSARSGRAPSWT